MPARKPFAVALLIAALAACSDQSPFETGSRTDGLQAVTTQAQPVLGTYILSVFSFTVEGLALKAEVKDAAGQPASGRVTFQYCSLQGQPAPSTECEIGSGHWIAWFPAVRLFSGHVEVCCFSAPSGTTVGLRFVYVGQGSGTANHPSNTIDFTF